MTFFQKSQIIDFFSVWLKELNLVSKKKRLRESNFLFKKWLIELNLFLWTSFQYDSKSWSLFSFWLEELKPMFFSKCLKELNFSFTWATFLHDSKNWIFSMWRKDFFKLTPRVEPTFSMTQRNDFVSPNDSKNWIMTQRMEPLFFEYDAKNWMLFVWIWRTELNPFSLNMTQRIEPFVSNNSENWTFEKKGLKDLNLLFFEHDAKNWTLCFK